jgi:hypothetical protein
VARTDGHRRGQGHLPSPAAERRMGPCSGQEPGPAAHAGARPREMPQCRCVVCDRS